MPFDPSRYPPDWRTVSISARVRSGGRCECEGECGLPHAPRCPRKNGEPLGGYRVVLTVAHLWRGPCAAHHAAGVKCGEPAHLKAMCQPCHLRYDLPPHHANARATRRAERRRRAAGDLFDETRGSG